MKSAWVVVLVCVVLTSAAFAQLSTSQFLGGASLTPRAAGMGGAAIGVADDAGAWLQNPAGLAALNVACPSEDKLWAADAVLSFADAGDVDGWALTGSAWKPSSAYGFGAGLLNIDDLGDLVGAGYGAAWKNTPFSWGVNVVNVSLDDDSFDDTIFNLGLMYRFAVPEKAPIRFGLLVEDITDQSDLGPFFSLGMAWPVTPQWLVAADVTDVTGETDDGPFFSGGVEYSFVGTGWKARAGFADTGDGHDLTLGAGYAFGNQWRVDAAWQNADNDDILSIGAGYTF
ncbi:MAG: hypothetical protein ABFE08_06410 [Armatimonadia bacterium]